MVEESAFNLPPEIDTRAFMWTFNCLDEDHELERFFAGLPGFHGSKMVKDPLPDLTWEQQEKLLNALIGLSDRTSSSDLLPEVIKIRRTAICGKALGPEDISQNNVITRVLRRIISGDHYALVKSADIVPFVRGWDSGKDGWATMMIQAIVPSIIARAQRRDNVWFAMAADEMGVPESLLRSHATHGNSLSLAILIWVIRKQYSLWKGYWPYHDFSKVLEAASKFDVLDASPELQHEFCALWNEVTRGADLYYARYILRPIRNIYLTLHLHTDCAPTRFSASTSDEDPILEDPDIYPLCYIPGHRPHLVTHIHVSASTATPPVLHDNAVLSPTFSPDVPSHSIITPVLVDENTVDGPLNDNMLVLASRVRQTATGDFHDSAASPDLAAAVAAQDDPPAQTMTPTIRAASTPTTSVPPSVDVSFQNNAGLLAPHSGSPEISSSTSPEPVLENILPTGTPPTLTLSYLNLTNGLT